MPSKAQPLRSDLVEAEIFEHHARFCTVFSSPTRLRIMWLLAERERTVGALSQALGLALANISQHLRVMRDQGAVRARREGKSQVYRISNPKFVEGARRIREGLVDELRRRERSTQPLPQGA